MRVHDDFKRACIQRRVIIAISLMAGGGDFASGLLLVLAPAQALAWMGAPMVKDPHLLQFVGVFVACVGASYLLGLLDWLWSGSRNRLRSVWEWTLLFRLAAGTFVAMQISLGNFAWAWVSVPLTDWTWALVQAVLLRLDFFDRGEC